MKRAFFLGVLTFALFVDAARAERWPALKPEDIRALASGQGEQWRRNARDLAVLPGAGPQGREAVRQLVQSTAPSSVALRETLLKEARFALAQPVPAYRTPEEVAAVTKQTLFDTRQELWMRRVGDDLVLFSFAAAIAPDDVALRNRVHDLALAACRYPQWGVREPNQDLAAGHVARGLAVAWSWNRGLWNDADAKLIRDTVRERVNTLAAVMSGGIYWAGAYQENHNHVSAAAVGFCGAAFIEDLPEDAVRWLATAQLNFEAVARYANADGSSPEGVPYWSYSASYILQYIEGVRGIIDVAPFYAGDWLRNMAAYRLRASTPGFGGTLPWGDASARDYYGPHHMLNRLAAEYRDPSAQYLAAKLAFVPQYGADVIAWNWHWHDPAVPAKPPESLDAHLPVADAVDSRSGWGAGDYLLAIKSGYTNRNHSHLDAGAIAFAFGGEWLLPAPGYGKGSGDKEFWDAKGGRWKYFSNATESHTTLLVNGRNQRFDHEARGTVARFASAPRSMWTEVDLHEAYEGVDAAWRRVFHRRGDYVLLLDDVILKEAGRVEWLLQVPPAAIVNGSEARIEGTAGSLAVRVIDPATALAVRMPLSPKVDVPATRLKTYAIPREGKASGFRTLLVPRFGGDLAPAPTVRRGADERYHIEGEGWSDELVFANEGSVLSVAADAVSANARLLVTRVKAKQVVDVLAVDAVSVSLPFGSLMFDSGKPTSVSATRINDELWVLDSDRAGKWLKKPDTAWRVSRGSDADELPAGRVLLMRGRATEGDYQRWHEEQTAVREQPGLPVRTTSVDLPVAPKESRVLVEAEAFATQVSGRVDVVDKPGNRGRSLRGFGNDSPFHAIAWKVSVPVAGTYRLRLRYCTPLDGTRVSLLVDGAAPGRNALEVVLPRTGGWSVDRDDWSEIVLAGADGTVVRVPLTAGEHEIRLLRPSGAINLDGFELIGGED
ncbi:MAG: heparinase II/III family protein [Rariglobus sp.]